MTYATLARWSFPPTLALALYAYFLRGPSSPDLLPGAPAPAPPRLSAVAPPAAPADAPASHLRNEPSPPASAQPFPPPGAHLTASPGPGPDRTNLPAQGEQIWLSEFDRALDREFTRLEAREKSSADPVDLAMVARLKEKLLALDALWQRADTVAAVEEKMNLQEEAQRTMGEIIQLGRADRNQRLTALARQFGVENGEDIRRFVDEVDRAFTETHLDWARLFNRGVVTPSATASP